MVARHHETDGSSLRNQPSSENSSLTLTIIAGGPRTQCHRTEFRDAVAGFLRLSAQVHSSFPIAPHPIQDSSSITAPKFQIPLRDLDAVGLHEFLELLQVSSALDVSGCFYCEAVAEMVRVNPLSPDHRDARSQVINGKAWGLEA